MIEPKELQKISDILNSEGSILGLYTDSRNKLYLGSFLQDGSGVIYYSVNLDTLKDYLQSKLTLAELYIKSQSFLIKHKFRKEEKTYLKGNHLVNDGDLCDSIIFVVNGKVSINLYDQDLGKN